MKHGKTLFLLAFIFATAAAFAGEALPSSAADWPAKLGMTPKMLFLVLQIGIIIFAAKIGGSIATALKLPSVLGELGAGILIGPWALGGFPIPGFDGMFQYGIFYGKALRAQAAAGGNPFAATPELYGICTIASVVLLFLSGLETNLKMFLKYAFAGSLVGVGGVVFSFLLGDLCAVYATTYLPDLLGGIQCLAELGELVKEGKVVQAALSPAAMFMGIMSTATSVGITARILSEKKKMDSEEGVTIMAGAVIDDVLGIIVLAIGMGIIGSQREAAAAGEAAAQGIDWGAIGATALKAFGVWLVGTIVGVVLAKKISWLLKLFKAHAAIATLAFGLALVIAGMFEALGLTLIIGAYVMGLALSRTDIKHLVQENLSNLYTFLVPIFFCVMGMMVDVTALWSKPVLIFGGIYTALAVLAKIVGCAIPSLFCGFNVLGALRVGAGMIPRGEVALIIAGIGLSNGYLTQEVFGIGILMTLVTTVVAPPALVGLFHPKAKGVRHPKADADGGREVVFELETRGGLLRHAPLADRPHLGDRDGRHRHVSPPHWQEDSLHLHEGRGDDGNDGVDGGRLADERPRPRDRQAHPQGGRRQDDCEERAGEARPRGRRPLPSGFCHAAEVSRVVEEGGHPENGRRNRCGVPEPRQERGRGGGGGPEARGVDADGARPRYRGPPRPLFERPRHRRRRCDCRQ